MIPPTTTRIDVYTVQELQEHCADLQTDLSLVETEHTWQRIERALGRLQALTRGGAFKFTEEFVYQIKQLSGAINTSLLSERTKLSGTAGDLVNSVAPRLADKFEPLVPVFVPTLLLICARTNKVAVKRAEKTLHLIVRHCKLSAGVIPFLREAIRDKGQGLRVVAATTFVLILAQAVSSYPGLESDKLAKRISDIEAVIRQAATDSNSEVRQATKKMFELYVTLWPERVEVFTKPLTPTIRRYLALPKTGSLLVHAKDALDAASSVPPTPASGLTNIQPKSVKSVRVVDATPQSNPASSSPSMQSRPTTGAQKPSVAETLSVAGTRPALTSRSRSDTWAMSDPAPQSAKRKGLFAEQIAAARTARLARSTESVSTPAARRVVSLDASTPSSSSSSGNVTPAAAQTAGQKSLKRKPSLDCIPSSSSSSSTSSDTANVAAPTVGARPVAPVTKTDPRSAAPAASDKQQHRATAPSAPIHRTKSVHDINQHFLPGSTKDRNCSMPSVVLVEKSTNKPAPNLIHAARKPSATLSKPSTKTPASTTFHAATATTKRRLKP